MLQPYRELLYKKPLLTRCVLVLHTMLFLCSKVVAIQNVIGVGKTSIFFANNVFVLALSRELIVIFSENSCHHEERRIP